jgi:hypothetical protein
MKRQRQSSITVFASRWTVPAWITCRRIDHFARPMIHRMMQTGMRVDLSHFHKMEAILEQDMERITEEVRAMTGVYCNLDSGDQVSELLFKKLKLKQARPKMTKSGDRESVENEVLVAVQHDHPVVPKILIFKELSKLKGTYVVPMPKLAQKVGFGHWRMYPKLGDTRVPSGRLNCKEPNLLAMPNRTERGRQICEGFITEENWVFVSIDESQIEPRVVAHRSMDAALMSIYFNEEDIYSDFAISAFRLEDKRHKDAEGWHYPGVHKKLHRFPSKTCILAAIYDVTNVGLLEQMPIVCANCGREASEHAKEIEGDKRAPCQAFKAQWTEDNCQDILSVHSTDGIPVFCGCEKPTILEPGNLVIFGTNGAVSYTLRQCGQCLSGLFRQLLGRGVTFLYNPQPKEPLNSQWLLSMTTLPEVGCMARSATHSYRFTMNCCLNAEKT